MDKIAILIPCYNESKSIKTVIESFKKELPDAAIYVFDNNSTDNTVSIAKKSGASIRLVPLQGKGNVIREMFRTIEADVYIMTDGDDTYDAKDVNKIVNSVKSGSDMVIGDRLNSSYFQENKRFGHNFGNILVRRMINVFFHSNIQDVMTGYRGFSRRFVKTCPIISNGFQVETEMTIHALDKKMIIDTVPVGYKDRAKDNPSKLNTYSDGMKVMMTIFNLIREYKPLFFFSIFSLLLLILALILGLPVFVDFLNTGLVDRIPTLVVSVMLLILTLLSFTTGLILDSLARRGRQQFEIDLMAINQYEQ